MTNEVPPSDWGNPKEQTFSEMSLKETEEMCRQMFSIKEDIQKHEQYVNEKKTRLRELQEKLMYVLTQHGKKNYDSNFGKVTVVRKLSVKCPKEPESRKAFFDYLKEKGIFEDLVTVHANTLNAFYKTEWENADPEQAVSFQMPGIGAPTYYEILQMRKG
jgi:hypothetical protein